MKHFDPAVPVYHAKFKDVLERIKILLKDFQHDLEVNQHEKNGATTSLEVKIVLKA